MKIRKMLLLAGMAMAAIAFAAPAAAQANVALTEPLGTKLVVGAKVTATSTNLKTTVGANTLECNKVTLHYEVVVNGPNHVVLDPVPTPGEADNGKAEGCVTKTPFGTFPNHITNTGTGQLTFNTWGQGSASSTFTSLTTFVNRHCSYTGPVAVNGIVSGGDELEVPGSTLHAPESGCEHGTIHGTLTVETTNGAPVFGHFVKTG